MCSGAGVTWASTQNVVHRLAYDGRGNAVVRSSADLESALAALGGYEHGLYAERWCRYQKVRRMPTFSCNIFPD